jgi:DNA-binding CsgD family transcriptional regulator/tetratricopeptide (TPR) repeat protein
MGVAAAEQLVEREAELEVIRAAVDKVSAGAGRLLAIEGPAGIGKTRLLLAARETAGEAGMRVLHARGSELEREFPYGLVRQLFEPALADLQEDERRALMSGAASTVEPLLAQGEPLPPPSIGDSSFPILHGLYWLTANLVEHRPLLLAIDDAHWGDLESLRFLTFLAGRLEEAPVLLALTARPTEPGAHGELIVAISSDPAAEVLRPAPLSDPAVSVLVKSALGASAADEFCEACHRASGGNPFVLHDLLSELRVEGIVPSAAAAADVANVTPTTVSRTVLLRLARLPQDALDLAQATAVLGDGADLRDAAALAGIDTPAAQEAADSLADVGLLSPARPLSFVHPLTRAAIYTDLPIGKRSKAHHAAARLLAERGADPDSIAVHLLVTDPAEDPGTVALLQAAASRALTRGTPDAAVRYLRRARAEPPPSHTRAAVFAELVTALGRAAEPLTPEELGEAQISELTSAPEQLLTCARELAWVLNAMGHMRDASGMLGGAIAAASETGAIDLALQFEVQRLFIDVARPNEIKARMDPYRERVVPGTAAHRLWIAVEAWRLMLVGENASHSAELARLALDRWQILAEQPSSPITGQLILVLVVAEDFEFAERSLDVILQGARAIGAAPFEAASLGLRSELLFRRGDIAGAAADARTAIDFARAHDFVAAMPLPIAWITQALTERGELEDAERELEDSGMAAQVPDHMSFTPILLCRAKLRMAQGKHSEALTDLKEIGRREARSETSFFPWDSEAAVGLAALGEQDEAGRLAQLGLDRARCWGAPGWLGHAMRSLGLVTGGDPGLERLRESVELLRDSPARLEYMRALTDLGAALRRAGRRADARQPLREALDLSRRDGALAIARRAHEELEATGEKLRPLIAVGVESLTPSERRIAGLAAEGLTNREIAQMLFLSVKTVESHLRGAFHKLDVRSREELPRALEGE